MTRRAGIEPPAPRWWQRVLPVSAIVAVALVVLTLLVAPVRHQLRLSLTRLPEHYVALSFARGSAGTIVICSSTRTQVQVSFVVDSHLAASRSLDFTIRAGHRGTTGSVLVAAGATAQVSETLSRPSARTFNIAVSLPEVGQRINGSCTPTA